MCLAINSDKFSNALDFICDDYKFMLQARKYCTYLSLKYVRSVFGPGEDGWESVEIE